VKPLPPDITAQDIQRLGDIDAAISGLDLAFSHLSDRSFACLSRSYQRLADAILRVVAERARHSV